MTNYPKNDKSFEESVIASVDSCDGGWSILRDDGWSFFVKEKHGVTPMEGMTARFYGKGIGFSVRGLYLDGVKVFYRSEKEQEEQHYNEMYGADAKEWLARWDSGKTVWSIEMGGMGPRYEQAIQITTAEILRHCIEADYDSVLWYNEEKAAEDSESIRKASFENEVIENLSLSGAMAGVAFQLATKIYMNGPISIMTDEQVKDRHIQVSKNFPKG